MREKIKPVVEEAGLELVDLDYFEGGPASTLRIYVDRTGGVTIGECADLSRKVSDVLDIGDFIPHRYMLEVSSPGLDRPLTKAADFRRRIGERVKVFLKEKVNGRTEMAGRIQSCEDECVVLAADSPISGSDEGSREMIVLEKIAWAKIML
ncbi:MAG: ribosome maturation factor RimP [Candidatus Zixiibacteriota bacterium]